MNSPRDFNFVPLVVLDDTEWREKHQGVAINGRHAQFVSLIENWSKK